MTLWPTGPTRGEEANEIEIGNLHESVGCALVSTLLAVIVTAAAGMQSASAVSSAEARKAIQAGYVEWGKARVAMDKNTIEAGVYRFNLLPPVYLNAIRRHRAHGRAQSFLHWILNSE